MGREPVRRAAGLAVLSVAVLLAIPASAGAVLSGWNGRIVFASGRYSADGDDSQAKLFLLPTFGDSGPSLVSTSITPTPGIQHRHPTWSPDRTKIAYAAGDFATKNFDIYVLDLTQPGAIPQNITNSNNVTDDRPAWSPDGTRIAWESEVTDGSGQVDVLVKHYPLDATPTLNLTNTTTAGQFEGKPAWTPDSQTIYYAVGDPGGANTQGIYKRPADGSGSQTVVVDDPTVSEFQPSISPDGTHFCFTRGSGVNATAEVYTAATANPTVVSNLSNDAGAGDYNCTWSPDNIMIAYVKGVFTTGALVQQRADHTQVVPDELTDDPGNFDGNPDWAPDGTPTCQPKTVSTGAGKSVTIALHCLDHGPAYEQTNVLEHIQHPPTHGTLGNIQQDPNPSPSTTAHITYKPNNGFKGTDTFVLYGLDFYQFAKPATITVEVGLGAPSLTNLKVKPKTWKRGSALPKISFGAAAVKTGTKISFKLSKAAKVTLKFKRKAGGKFKTAGQLKFSGHKGKNSVKLQGPLSNTKVLPLGSYRLEASAKDAAGRVSKTKTATFTIVAG